MCTNLVLDFSGKKKINFSVRSELEYGLGGKRPKTQVRLLKRIIIAHYCPSHIDAVGIRALHWSSG